MTDKCREQCRVAGELTALRKRLAEIGTLKAGWLDGEGLPVSAADAVGPLLAARVNAGFPRPRVYPTLEGGVQAERETDGTEYSLTVRPDGTPETQIMADSPE